MDIEYLLLLQNLRDVTGTAFAEFMGIVSKVAVSELAVIMMCLIYWVVDRQAGKRIFGGFALGVFMNGLLKLIFCVYRPWIRDPRVTPYGDSKVAATGYSFPSGHSTWATSCFGGTGEWLRRRGHRVPCALFWIFAVLVMFSRNFLGVHTPQDVMVGFAATALCMLAVYKMEAWTDEDPKRDFYVMAAGLVLCVAAAVFYLVKPYPLDYAADGSLLVDPANMINDSFQGIGFVAGYVVCRTIERRGFAFDQELTMRERLICSIIGLIPLTLILVFGLHAVKLLIGTAARNVVMFFFLFFYTMVIMPAGMSLMAKAKAKKQLS